MEDDQMKTIDFSKPIYDLSAQYPDFIPILSSINMVKNFDWTTIKDVGRLIDVQKMASMENVPMNTVIEAFEKEGFRVTGIKH
jgi:hypothetical protein